MVFKGIEVELNNATDKSLEKTQIALKRVPPVDLLLCWETPDEQNFFRSNNIMFPEGIKSERLYNKIENSNLRNIQVPIVTLNDIFIEEEGSLNEDFLLQFTEWMGCVHNKLRKYAIINSHLLRSLLITFTVLLIVKT